MIYLLGEPLVAANVCSLCDEIAIGVMMILIDAVDKVDKPTKRAVTQMEFAVCEQHSLNIQIGLEKRLKRYDKPRIILL